MIRDLIVQKWLGVDKNIAVDVLFYTASIYGGNGGIFPSEPKGVLWHSSSLSKKLSLRTVSWLLSDTSVVKVELARAVKTSDVQQEKEEEEIHLC